MISVKGFIEYLFSPDVVALIIGGILVSFFGLKAALSKTERTPKWIAWGATLSGLVVILSGIYSGYENQQASKQLQSKTEEVAQISKENAKISKENAKLSKSNANLNKKIAGFLTGGDSYCYVMMTVDKYSGWAHLRLFHRGEYPIHQISIQFVDQTLLGNRFQENLEIYPIGDKERYERARKNVDLLNLHNKWQKEATRTYNIPVLSPSTVIELGSFEMPIDKIENHYLIRIFSVNGIITQETKYRKIEGNWKFSFRVNKDNLVLKESIHPEIPLSLLTTSDKQ